MSDIPNKMSHNTVESVGLLSDKSTDTGGMAAKHNLARLKSSFPASPLYESYTSEKVAKLKKQMLMNDVMPNDQGDSQSHWGYSQIDANEEAPSGVDLSYSGAPSIKKLTVLKPGGSNVDSIVVPFYPVLAPNMANLSGPQKVNVLVPRLKLANNKQSVPPFSGDGTLDPQKSSLDIRKLSLGED